jgi:ureidoglycolate lyase
MSGLTLRAVPLTPDRFSPYGDVIHASAGAGVSMNDAHFERFAGLATVDADDRHVAISIVRCRVPAVLPHRFDMVERHPLGSQAFIPLARFRFYVVVAAAGESVGPEDLQAFVTNGTQGINYNKGVWHMPIIGLEAGQEFLVIDRGGNGDNCEEHCFSDPVTLLAE